MKGIIATSVSFVVAGLSSAAFAQGAAPEVSETTGLEEIIVTAQRRAEPLQSVPVAVSAFSANALEKMNTSTITGLQGLVPGFTIIGSAGSMNTPQFSLRGISQQDVEKSSESGVGITLDGVPLGVGTGALLGAFDVERIEVLRGPQGLLFGKNTTGGTINVIRTRPNPDGPVTGKLRLTLGSFGQNYYEGVISGPLIPGKLAAKAAISVQKDDGHFKNRVFGGHYGDRDLKDFVFSLNATPTDRLSMLLTLERQEDDTQIPPFAPILTPNVVPLGVPGYFGGANGLCLNPATAVVCLPPSKKRNSVEQTPNIDPSYLNLNAVTFEAGYDADSVKLVGITGYRELKQEDNFDADGTRFALFRIQKPQKYHQFSQEVRAESKLDGPFNFVAGLFYFKGKYNAFQNVSLDLAAIAPVVPGTGFLNSLNSFNTIIGTRSFAIFFQGDYKLTDELKLTVGARQTWDRKTIDFTQYAPVASSVRDLTALGALVGNRKDSAKFNKLTPKVGLEYKITPRVLTYASFSRGYNVGGFNGRPPNPSLVIPFQPETLDAYEIGLKSDFLNNRVRFNIAAYHNTMKNKQEDLLVIQGTSNGTVTVNAAKARYQGVEVELAVVPVRGWTISSSAGYMKAKYLSFVGNLGQGTADLSGLKLRRTPKFTAGLVSDYVTDLGSGTLGLNAVFTYVSRYETNILNDPRGSIPPVGKIDLAARYEFPPTGNVTLEIAGFVKNVTDNTTYSGQSSGNSVGTFLDYANPQVGRQFGGSLTARF